MFLSFAAEIDSPNSLLCFGVDCCSSDVCWRVLVVCDLLSCVCLLRGAKIDSVNNLLRLCSDCYFSDVAFFRLCAYRVLQKSIRSIADVSWLFAICFHRMQPKSIRSIAFCASVLTVVLRMFANVSWLFAICFRLCACCVLQKSIRSIAFCASVLTVVIRMFSDVSRSFVNCIVCALTARCLVKSLFVHVFERCPSGGR